MEERKTINKFKIVIEQVEGDGELKYSGVAIDMKVIGEIISYLGTKKIYPRKNSKLIKSKNK